MAKTFDQSKDEIAKLCQYFATNQQNFLALGVKEAHVRQSLIDPFFEALGWDVRNSGMAAPQYREVIPEDSLEIEGQQKAPDYTFRVGTLPKFFTEAKKCGININADPAPAYQLRRYGWSAKVSLSVLTDFEEFAVYDCSQRPTPGDKASHARIQYLEFSEYPDRWRELWDVFSREAVWSGSFDQYADHKKKRGTSEVDTEFLKDIEGWRDELARNLALRNENLSVDDLNAAVQRIIDRIIFLRMAEDRGLEAESQLLTLCDQPNIYSRFMSSICQKADEKYNSGLFHFSKDSSVSEIPDSLTPRLEVDDKILKPILQSLYFEHGSPYHFGVLPVEILGTVYERFLGKVIRLTTGHHARVEPKPEVRKAGGVYYTPAYIVDYIVKNTVGKQVEGKSPAELAGGKNKQPLRILDMACGSGSFLLGAYQFLLDHCLKWYIANQPEKHSKAIYRDTKGEWRLAIGERKRILTTHLFGVDIDRQAVEVTKLSLLLKALEGENDASLSQQMQLFHDRALPNLANNIKCGNSLIGPDYFSRSLIPDLKEMKRINAFDWTTEFPDALKAGGFDCIIGNPPYIRIQTMKEWAPLEVEILKEIFKSAASGSYDIYVAFLEHGLSLLNPQGELGFICPHKFFNSQYGEAIRGLIAEGQHLSRIVHFGAQQVFEGATTYTCLIFLSSSPIADPVFVNVSDLSSWRVDGSAVEGRLLSTGVTSKEWNFSVGRGSELVARLAAMPEKLGNLTDIFVGLQTSADDVYIMEFISESKHLYRLKSKSLGDESNYETDLFLPIVSGTDVRRYGPLPKRQFVLFPYSVLNEQPTLIEFKSIQTQQPKTASYLLANRKRLESREKGAFRDLQWYRFGRSQNLGIQHRVKLCVPRLVERLHASFDEDGSHCLDNVDVGGITLKPRFAGHGFRYLLALLNSRLLQWYFPHVSAPFRGNWRSANRQFLSLLPIPMLDLRNKRDAELHAKLVSLVNAMMSMQVQIDNASSDAEKEVLHRRVASTDSEIDGIVYALYELSDDDIRIVEEDSQH